MKYMIVLVDSFSRWVEIKAVPEATAEATAQFLCEQIGRFGRPTSIRHDGASHFVNHLLDCYMEL